MWVVPYLEQVFQFHEYITCQNNSSMECQGFCEVGAEYHQNFNHDCYSPAVVARKTRRKAKAVSFVRRLPSLKSISWDLQKLTEQESFCDILR